MIAMGSRGRRLPARLRARLHRLAGEDVQAGSAIIEFVFLAVLMLVPLFYLVMLLARLQAGAYAVSAASREAGRAYVTTQMPAQPRPRADSAAGLALADQGFDYEIPVEIVCNGNGDRDGLPCLRPEARVRVTATVSVPMPLVPEFFSRIVPMRIPVSATHIATVDRFRGQ